MQQRSEDWFNARAGKATSSRVAALTARTKSGWAASRANTIAQLVAERLSGTCQDTFTSPAMQWGIDHEDEARAAYEFMTDNEVEQVGFVVADFNEWLGASPDGLVGNDGLIEIKCPNTATHIETLLGGSIPIGYQKQMMWQMICTKRKWCDFVSYDPRLPVEMQLHVERFQPDDEFGAELLHGVLSALDEVAEKVEALKSKYK